VSGLARGRLEPSPNLVINVSLSPELPCRDSLSRSNLLLAQKTEASPQGLLELPCRACTSWAVAGRVPSEGRIGVFGFQGAVAAVQYLDKLYRFQKRHTFRPH